MQCNAYQAVPPLTQEQEMELAPLARDGDRFAQDTMLRSVAPLVQSLAARACRAGVEVGDLVQTGMISVWRALRSFDPSLGRWSSWAGRHAKFDILHAAQDGAPIGSPLIDTPAPDVDADEVAAREQSAAAIRAGLRALLGADDAEVVGCKILEDLTETQTARRLHRSWRTVRASEQRGMARLREVVRARA